MPNGPAACKTKTKPIITSATAPVSKGVGTAYTALKKTKKQYAKENMLGGCLTLPQTSKNIGNHRNIWG